MFVFIRMGLVVEFRTNLTCRISEELHEKQANG